VHEKLLAVQEQTVKEQFLDEASKNLAEYRLQNNFVWTIKIII